MSRPGTASIANLRRLFAPRHIAVFGGSAAAEVVRQCKALGFAGEIWPVHPSKDTLEGLPCYPGVSALPAAPDASFIAVPRGCTVEIVAALSARGAGGVTCYASGFAEAGGEGVTLQQQLVQAAGALALLGPNCYGMLNYLDGVALWPDQHGGERLARGVAIVTQSGNIGLNLTMQRRALPLAYVVTVGNKAGASLDEIVDALLQDNRVSAVGLHMEGLDDVAAFSRVALKALAARVPLVVLKSGSSDAGARTTMSHTSSLAGPDVLYDALFARFGVARVYDLAGLVETLKFLHVYGALAGRRIASASCSGGEASLVADLAQPRGLDMPGLPEPVSQQLGTLLGDKVHVANPLDYHTYIWGDMAAQTACFAALMECKFDMHLLVLDFPRVDRCDGATWQLTVDAWVAAHKRTGAPAGVLASLPEGLPDGYARKLLADGIAPMQGLTECMEALVNAAQIGVAQRRAAQTLVLGAVAAVARSDIHMLDEAASKQALAVFGLPLPRSEVVVAGDAVACAVRLGYPVVVKAVSHALAHKTEAGGVQLNLMDDAGVAQAVAGMAHLSDRFLIEQMVTDAVAEVIVGVHRDAQFGLALTVGAGGVFVELLQDTVTLLLPITRADVREALASLKTWPLVCGYRSRPEGDVEALLDAVMAIAAYAQANSACLEELDVNPLIVRPKGRGVLAVDAMIRISWEN